MNVQGNPSDIEVLISHDGSEAFLAIPADFPREHLTAATEVMYETRQTEENIEKAAAAMTLIDAQITKRRTVKLSVTRWLYENCRLTICQQQLRVDKDVAGPLVVTLNEHGEPVYQQGDGEQRPLTLTARKLKQGPPLAPPDGRNKVNTSPARADEVGRRLTTLPIEKRFHRRSHRREVSPVAVSSAGALRGSISWDFTPWGISASVETGGRW